MKVRASIKKRSADCKIVEEKADCTSLTRRTQNLNKDKVKLNYGENCRY
jgi:ribosomal protein L36